MSAMVTSGMPPETQMHMPVSLLHHLLSTVPPSAAQSEAIHAWLAGLVGSLTLGGEETSYNFSDRVFGNPKGSCQGTAEISGVAEEDAEVAIAAKTKKDAAEKPDQEELGTSGAKKPVENMGEEETSCSFSDRVFGNPKGSCQGIAEISGVAEEDAEVAIAAKTKKTAAKKPGQEG